MAVVALLASACAGEAIVTYRGTVTAAGAAGHSFDDAPNPAGLPPIAGAEVALLVCDGRCRGGEASRAVPADAAGEWGPLDRVFGGFAASHEIQVRVSAPGYRSYVYSTVYESNADPAGGQAWLNVTLAPG